MPPRFEWNIVDLWLPAEMNRGDDPRSPRGLRAFQAHLRPGVTPAEAEAQLNVVGARRAAEYPKDYPPHWRFEVITVIDWVVREFRGVLYTLFGAVSLLMVIACCNVANMLLARATTREREIGIRAAIGASRSRIVRQLLVESALLAFGGLVAGCLLLMQASPRWPGSCRGKAFRGKRKSGSISRSCSSRSLPLHSPLSASGCSQPCKARGATSSPARTSDDRRLAAGRHGCAAASSWRKSRCRSCCCSEPDC